MPMTDNDFEFVYDCSDLEPYTGSLLAPTGYYKTKVVRLEKMADKDKHARTRFKFVHSVTEGPHAGVEIWDWLSMPDGKDAKANKDAAGWFTGMLVSGGVDSSKLKTKLKLSKKNLEGKVFHLFYEAKDESKGASNSSCKWLPVGLWTVQAESFAKNGGSDAQVTADDTEGVAVEKGARKPATQRRGKATAKVEEKEDDIVPDTDEGDSGDALDFADAI